MSNYGGGAYPNAPVYGTSGDYSPSEKEMLSALLWFNGQDGVFTSDDPVQVIPIPRALIPIYDMQSGKPGTAGAIAKNIASDILTGNWVTGLWNAGVSLWDMVAGIHRSVVGSSIPPAVSGLHIPPVTVIPGEDNVNARLTEWQNNGVPFTSSQQSDLANVTWGVLLDMVDLFGDPISVPAFQALAWAAQQAAFRAVLDGIPVAENPSIKAMYDTIAMCFAALAPWRADTPGNDIATVDWTQRAAGESIVDFLNRMDTGYLWQSASPGGYASGPAEAWSEIGPDSAWLHAAAPGLAVGDTLTIPLLPIPPVWPGAAHATLGDAMYDVGTGSYTVACDGLLVYITSTAPGAGKQRYAGRNNWLHAGWVSFTSDHGEQEPFQWLGLEQVVYAARTMAHAAGFAMWCAPGVKCTVVPWSVAT